MLYIERIENKPAVEEQKVDEKIGQLHATVLKDISAVENRVTNVENSKSYKDALEQNSIKCNIVLRKVRESAEENLINKVTAVLIEGCKLKDVKVLKAERKGKGHNGVPPPIVATLQSSDQVKKVLRTKKLLKESRNHKDVFIHEDEDLDYRIQKSNTITLLKALGKDKEY